jgi:hypothetical protein
MMIAASMVILDTNRRSLPVPPLGAWCLGVGILASVAADVAHDLAHGVIGALVSAWPALALCGAYKLLMRLIKAGQENRAAPRTELDVPASAPTMSETVRAWHDAGHSQRTIARKLNIDRRKVKQIIDHAA